MEECIVAKMEMERRGESCRYTSARVWVWATRISGMEDVAFINGRRGRVEMLSPECREREEGIFCGEFRRLRGEIMFGGILREGSGC